MIGRQKPRFSGRFLTEHSFVLSHRVIHQPNLKFNNSQLKYVAVCPLGTGGMDQRLRISTLLRSLIHKRTALRHSPLLAHLRCGTQPSAASPIAASCHLPSEPQAEHWQPGTSASACQEGRRAVTAAQHPLKDYSRRAI